MKNNGREIEHKYEISGASVDVIKAVLGRPDAVVKKSYDAFWELEYEHPAFIRYRQSDDSYQVKIEDKGTVTDRIEIDLPAIVPMTMPLFKVHKSGYVWKSYNIEYSAYYVYELDKFFVEIEGKTMKDVQIGVKRISGIINAPEKNITQSLFSLMKEKISNTPSTTPSDFPTTRRGPQRPSRLGTTYD